MGMFTRVTPPRLPSATPEYSQSYMSGVLNVLYLFFQQIDAVQPMNMAGINFNLQTLPTQADLANLREGDVYRDTSAGNVLKVKV
jgi:hypothetical protein